MNALILNIYIFHDFLSIYYIILKIICVFQINNLVKCLAMTS